MALRLRPRPSVYLPGPESTSAPPRQCLSRLTASHSNAAIAEGTMCASTLTSIHANLNSCHHSIHAGIDPLAADWHRAGRWQDLFPVIKPKSVDAAPDAPPVLPQRSAASDAGKGVWGKGAGGISTSMSAKLVVAYSLAEVTKDIAAFREVRARVRAGHGEHVSCCDATAGFDAAVGCSNS